jgi:hypothetical protein
MIFFSARVLYEIYIILQHSYVSRCCSFIVSTWPVRVDGRYLVQLKTVKWLRWVQQYMARCGRYMRVNVAAECPAFPLSILKFWVRILRPGYQAFLGFFPSPCMDSALYLATTCYSTLLIKTIVQIDNTRVMSELLTSLCETCKCDSWRPPVVRRSLSVNRCFMANQLLTLGR